jgi:hypothetical protein
VSAPQGSAMPTAAPTARLTTPTAPGRRARIGALPSAPRGCVPRRKYPSGGEDNRRGSLAKSRACGASRSARVCAMD